MLNKPPTVSFWVVLGRGSLVRAWVELHLINWNFPLGKCKIKFCVFPQNFLLKIISKLNLSLLTHDL
jgi:hypothetical protein